MPEGNTGLAARKNSVVRALGVLASSTVLSQLLLLLVSPVLTRLYAPEDFGLFAVYIGISALLALISCLSYDTAIPYARDDAAAAALVRLCFLVLPVLTATIAIPALTAGDVIFGWFNLEHAAAYAWAVPVTVFLLGCFQIGQSVMLRRRKYSAFARSNISQSVGTAAGQLVLGLAAVPGGIVVGYVFGRFVGAVSALSNLRLRTVPDRSGGAPTALHVASEYRKWPLFLTWSSLLNQLSTLLPAFLMSAYFDAAVAGLLALSQRVLQLPALVISSAVSKVFISLAHDAQQAGALRQLTETLVKALSMIGIPGLCLTALVAPELFSMVFGASWRQAGLYAQCLLPWLAITFIASPLAAVLPALQKQQYELMFQIVLITARATALAIGIIEGSALLAVALFGAVSAVCWIAFMAFSLSLVGHRATKVGSWLIKEFALTVPFLVPVAATKLTVATMQEDWMVLLSGLVCGVGLASVMGWRLIRMHRNAGYLHTAQ